MSNAISTKVEKFNAPSTPTLSDVSHDSVLVEWNPPFSCRRKITSYDLYYKKVDHKKTGGWSIVKTDGLKARVCHLEPSTRYVFRVRAIGEYGSGEFSSTSDPVKTAPLPLIAPGVPEAVEKRETSLAIQWAAPSGLGREQVTYELFHKIDDCSDDGYDNDNNGDDHGDYDDGNEEESWLSLSVAHPHTDLQHLLPDTSYVFKVRALREELDEMGPFSKVSRAFATKPKGWTYTARLMETIEPASMENGLKMYKLPLQKMYEDTATKTQKYVLNPSTIDRKERVIMVVGATGSGKSTLIDGLINYVVGVNWNDDYRFKLVCETVQELKNKSNQAISQTEWITAYSLNTGEEGLLSFDLTVVDTPGFGDTRGIERDKQTIKQIKNFFSNEGDGGIDHLDAVCFVVQSPQARLTPTQRFIFDSILSIFGHDIKDNIFVLVTFADGQDPPCVAALKEAQMPYKMFFKMNNSALFIRNKGDVRKSGQTADFDQFFWDMGRASFSRFFQELNQVTPCSLQLTKQVLSERENLETTVVGLHMLVREGMDKMNQLMQEMRILKNHEADIRDNKDFNYEVYESKSIHVKLEPGIHVTNCLVCNFTCHNRCAFADDKDKINCCAMRKGSCTVCVQKCIWNQHKNMPYRFEITKEKVKKTYKEMQDRYQQANAGRDQHLNVVQCVKEEYSQIKIGVQQRIVSIKQCLERLSEIALCPNYMTTTDYIDTLIESEKQQMHIGWKDRVRMLTAVRQQTVVLQAAASADDALITDMEDDFMEGYDFEADASNAANKTKHPFRRFVTNVKKAFSFV